MRSQKQSPLWHPFTQHGLEPEMTEIAGAEGAWLTTPDGRRILDAISSWWVVTHGHRHPKIIAAIKDQADTLDQVIFAGFTHKPAEDLARMLMKFVPVGLEHVFFSDSGSTAVEVALENGAWVLAQHRQATIAHSCARTRLSRRHNRHDVGGRTRRFQFRL